MLLHGDCLELMKIIPDGSVDMILTDPPYGTTACKWDNVIPFESMWQQIWRVLKPNGACLLFGSEPFSSALRMSQIKRFRYDWIWDKGRTTGFALAKKQPLRKHECISVFSQEQSFYLPQKSIGKPNHSKTKGNIQTKQIMRSNKSQPEVFKTKVDLSGMKYPTSILYFPREAPTKYLHPTQKPVPLLEYFIKTYTIEGETVLDFTMGSGSTGVACANTNREFIGIEQDGKYFDIAQNRIGAEKVGERSGL